jgi:hypothetical protein
MNSQELYFAKTKMPTPDIDWTEIWSQEPTDRSLSAPRYKEYKDFQKFLDSETGKLLKSIKLYPRKIRIFRWKPVRVFPWHIDGTKTEKVNFAINWVLDGKGKIQWNSKMNLPRTPSGLSWASKLGTFSDASEYETFGHQCVVNTSIPHRVVNISKVHRITVSMMFQEDITYEGAINILKANDLLEI